MRGRLGGAFLVLIATLAVVFLADRSQATEHGDSGVVMCPPVTLDDLFPPEEVTTTTETGDEAGATTTAPTTTTTTTGVTEPEIPEDCEPFRYEMGWPLMDEGRYISGFAAPRDRGERRHKGVDVAAPILTPVVAVSDGRIGQVHHETGTDDCCWMVVEHADGWESWYLHLNNDIFDSDDGSGFGIRTDLERGTWVEQGEVLGWLGDSGNAEHTVVHLHFELRDPEGNAVDPWESLKAARAFSDFTFPETPGPYLDLTRSGSGRIASLFVTEGLHLACDDLGLHLCPDRVADPEFVSEIAGHLAGDTGPSLEGRYRRVPTVFAPTTDDEATLEQLLGCNPLEECLEFGVPETEVARAASWILIKQLVSLQDPVDPEEAPEVRVPSAVDAEASLRRLGALTECHPPLDPEQVLSRAETLDRFAWWVLAIEPNPCPVADQPNR